MSKDKYLEIIDGAFAAGTPFINYTEYYSFALIPKGGDSWVQASYDFEDHEVMEEATLTGAGAYNALCEEIEKAMSEELETFYLNRWKEFKGGLGGSEAENVVKLIEELKNNTATYCPDFPAVFSADSPNMGALKGKL